MWREREPVRIVIVLNCRLRRLMGISWNINHTLKSHEIPENELPTRAPERHFNLIFDVFCFYLFLFSSILKDKQKLCLSPSINTLNASSLLIALTVRFLTQLQELEIYTKFTKEGNSSN